MHEPYGTENEIIEASITLFCERGLDLTSMQDIANAAGISKATLYFYFDSKAALIQEVHQHCYQMDVDACNFGMEQEKDGHGQAVPEISQYHQLFHEPPQGIHDRTVVYSLSGLLRHAPAV